VSVAKIIEISSSSKKGFEDAIEKGISRASKTIKHIAGAWVKEQSVTVENGKIVRYQVNLMVTFVLEEKDASVES
jgi:hypothetical protein